jgi:putative aminopeptidase FrvX
MTPDRLDFLKTLLTTPGPSGFETRVAKVYATEAAKFANVEKDHYGNVYASINAGAKLRIMLSGHLDEIGLIVTHIDKEGFIWLSGVGGWQASILLGQRLRLLAKDGDLIGVIGTKPTHLIEADDRNKAIKLEDLWLDLGLSAEEVKQKVRVGDVAVIEQPVIEFGNGRIASKALDNRIGAFVVLEVLRGLTERGCQHHVITVGSTQEEIGLYGAKIAAFKLEPHAAIAVDVTFETSQPGSNVKKTGESAFGSGANLTISPMTNPVMNDGIRDIAKKENLALTTAASANSSGTDADEIILARAGIPTAVLSVPVRHMHSPSEMADTADIQTVIDLMVAYIMSLSEGVSFQR